MDPTHEAPAHAPRPMPTDARADGVVDGLASRSGWGPVGEPAHPPAEPPPAAPWLPGQFEDERAPLDGAGLVTGAVGMFGGEYVGDLAGGAVPSSLEAARVSAGHPLDSALQQEFGSSLGVELGSVKVHTGSASAAAAAELGASAYAEGQHIHMGAGQYDPKSEAGRHLLAHEVAHTVQQRGASTGAVQLKLDVSEPGDAHEQSADCMASAMVRGESAAPFIGPVLPASIARKGKSEPVLESPAAPPGGIPVGVERAITKLIASGNKKKVADYLVHLADYLGHPEILAARLADAEDSLGQLFASKFPAATRKTLISQLDGGEKESGSFNAATAVAELKKLGMTAVLRVVAKHYADGNLPALRSYVVKTAWRDARTKAAMQAVTLKRGASPREIALLNVALQGLPEDDVAALTGYLSQSLGTSKEAEGALSQLDADAAGAISPGALAGIRHFGRFSVKAGGWKQPKGQPAGLYIGLDVHDSIGQFYKGSRRESVVEPHPLPTKSLLRDPELAKLKPNKKGASSSKLGLKPDITNLSTLELYEIKPWTNPGGAAAEAAMYMGIFNAVGIPMKLGSSTAIGTVGVVRAPGGHARFWSPAPGVIIYQMKHGDYVPAPEPQKQSQENENPGMWKRLEQEVGLTGTALAIYLIISEGSRLFPPRNMIPVP